MLPPDTAIFGNVGTLVAFRLRATDAKTFSTLFAVDLETADLTRLPNLHVYVRPFVNGAPVTAFSA